MVCKNILGLVIVGALSGIALAKSETELLARYEEIQQELGVEGIANDRKIDLEAEQHRLTMEMANLSSTSQASSSGYAESPVSIVEEKATQLVVVASPGSLVAHVPAQESKAERTTLKAKLDLVFKRFIVMHHLDEHAVVLAEGLEREFINKLRAFDEVDKDQQRCIHAEIVAFVETARLLFYKMQLLTVSPALVGSLFGGLAILHVDKQRLSNIFVKVLHAVMCTGNKIAHESLLFSVLAAEKVIQASWKTPFKNRNVKRAFAMTFRQPLADLMQGVVELEGEIEAIPVLQSTQHDTFKNKFIHRADVLMHDLQQEKAFLCARSDAAAVWAQFFVYKIILLKRAMSVQVQLARGGKHACIHQEVYVKHNLIVFDPMFQEMLSMSQLAGAAKHYESLVGRFLMGQLTPCVDSNREHLMLLMQLRGLLGKIVPSCSGTHAVINTSGHSLVEAFRATYTPTIPTRKSSALYADLLREMITILEEIGKVLQNNGFIFNAASSVVTNLLGDRGLLVNLGPKELQFGATALGIAPEQLKAMLACGSNNPKETVMRLLAHASPMLVTAILQYVRTGDIAGSKPVGGKDVVIAKAATTSGVALEAQVKDNPALIRRIEMVAPGLMDLLAGQVQAGLQQV